MRFPGKPSSTAKSRLPSHVAGRRAAWSAACLLACLVAQPAALLAEPPAPPPASPPAGAATTESLQQAAAGLEGLGLGSTLKLLAFMTLFGVAPAAILMSTSFVRLAVVLGMLRHALGVQQAPSNQIVASLALFLTLLIMTPVWQQVYDQSLRPYQRSELTMAEAWQAGVTPLRRFMSRQIEAAGNSEDVWLFYRRLPESRSAPPPRTYDDVPLQVLLPAFMVSELKTAFLIGFQIYLPFLILDVVVASVTASMGMVMLPPSTVALPLKLMLFVLVDGWRLVIGALLDSFAPL